MRFNPIKSRLVRSGLALVLLLGGGTALAQTTVNLTAGPATAQLPDGSSVPMWGYSCGAAVTGSSGGCASLNPNVGAGGWSPVVITVPSGQALTINLTNNLSFSTGSTTPANTIPTSIVIVGQVGGGLGNSATSMPSPAHSDLSVSWPTANTGASFIPPPQLGRVQSMATEVVATGVTPVSPQVASGSSLTWAAPRPGTYLIESGTHPSIQGPMGLYGILVVTTAPAGTSAGVAYGSGTTAVNYSAEIPLLLSEIDPVQNAAVAAAVGTAGFSETTVWSGQPGGCGNSSSPTFNQCYPPAVNYTPLYYMINGVAFDKTHAASSVFAASIGTASAAPLAGSNLLVRLVNAGLRMHVPSIPGAITACYPLPPATTCPGSGGFALIAEDGNVLPGRPRVQSEVFMAAGKTYDVMVQVPAPVGTATTPPALPIYDRELSLSGNAVMRDAGMLAYIGVNGATAPAAAANQAALAVTDNYTALVAGQTLTVSDPSKGVIANDTNVYGVLLLSPAANGTVVLAKNGTFTYTPTGTATTDSFTYCANTSAATLAAAAGVCPANLMATVNLKPSNITDAAGVTCVAGTFNSNIATYLAVKTPGLLAGCSDGAKLPLSIVASSVSASGCTVVADVNGGFTASSAGAGACTVSFQAKNSLGALSAVSKATVNFPVGSNLVVNVLDGTRDPTTGALVNSTPIQDYRWVIEEDRTFYIDPTKVTNNGGTTVVPTLGVNFHTSYMPFVAQGCTGPVSCEGGQSVLGAASVCDVSNGVCRPDSTGNGFTPVMPGAVHLDPTKRYYISVLPGDAADPFIAGCATAPDPTNSASCIGHGMGGAPIGIDPNTLVQQSNVTVYSQPSPYQPAKLSVFVFEDDFPLNGEQDGGGGVDVVGPVEPGLGGFEIVLWDAMGGNGDFTGQMTHDMFNQPLSNALDGTIDPLTQQNACPISQQTLLNPAQAGITGRIVTCPKYEADGKTLSPLAGQAVIANLMPMRMGVIATPAADRIARGEEWLQTNTLDGQKAHDAFAKVGEPSYFQEFGPASYHVSIGFANPAIINARLPSVCDGTNANASVQPGHCKNTLTGMVTGQRLSRTPDERLYNSGTHDAFYWTQCYVSIGDPDGIDFAFTKCAADGSFKFTGLPDGDWRITTFDQWNDQLVDGLSTPVRLGGTKCTAPNVPAGCNPSPTPSSVNMQIAATQWQTNLYTRTFTDDNHDGLSQATETGIPFANVAVRLRDGSIENLQLTDFTGTANFNETFPLFSWYTVETDVTRYKNTGTHVVYDSGGPADNTPCGGTTGYPPCGTSTIGKNLANTVEEVSVPTNLRVPGAIYCAGADCVGKDMSGLAGSKASDAPSVCTTTSTGATSCSTTLSTGRIDPPWVGVEGWQGFPGQNNFLEFGKAPYYPGENGGIKGHVVYASTRPFDDPQSLVQTQWESLVPNVGINLYQEGVAADGVTPTLTLVDHTTTTSFDDFAQGFRADGVTPNMNCPGQGAATGPIPDLFFFSLYNQPNYLNAYNAQHGGPAATALPNNSQFKCYDGMHNWNQLQPAPYDGQYQFPSVTTVDANGRPTGTNCTICAANPDPVPTTGDGADPLRHGLPMLPPGKYVVEIVVPPGMELVKEEDKNILIGDNYIAPVTQQFGALGNIFIIPDQASVAGTFSAGSGYNANSWNNPTQNLGAAPLNGIVPGFVPEPLWPCVGASRIVPDYISLFPQSHQVAPFAGATRNLCDRKEVTLSDQSHSIAKFYVFTSTHIASKFTGGITDDFTSEFDPFSPQFGEKFSPPDLPVSIKDWTGTETNRVYADHWGAYNGMTYSTWEVNPPNPTGYAPTMMVFCMNDPGPITDTRVGSATNGQLITDPLFSQGYSQFCYELPFMPGTTQYLDTPVVPTSAFAGAGYNNVDCAEPDATPAIKEVDGDGIGPWVSASGKTVTITALGDQMVPNNAYSGPSATTAPFNQKTIKRHYGFGATQGTGTVSIGGINATVTSWSDTAITVTVPAGVPSCPIQQQAQYGGSAAQCGQLLVTTGSGKQSIDTVTVTVGGKAPTHVAASSSIQAAIDGAQPGDLIIIDPTCQLSGVTTACTTAGVTTNSTAAHNELVLMWKPVRLQGVGASASVINANTHPSGKLDPWRAKVDCLFGLSPDGTPVNYDPGCGNGLVGFNAAPNAPQVDRLPFESTVGWMASLSGNLAEQLQEPSLMGALEGAGITVLSKGVDFHGQNPFDPTLIAGFPVGTTLLTGTTLGDANSQCHTSKSNTANPFPSNFQCNPSSIDGIGITNSSQGGGGILVHAWAHHLQIANNRVYNNSGTLSGGINLGQGEFPPAYFAGSTTNSPPGSCETAGANGAQLPYCHNTYVNVHNNYISLNNSTGDELFSATPAGNGGASICTGADYYKFNYNWVCGNLSSGDGGGVGHLGFSKNGDIEHNAILFNQSTNPTIPTNGGGLLVMGTPDADPACGATTDQDCVSPLGAVGPSDGIGPGLVINANLIMGNAAESGSGGGIAFQGVNGGDVVAFPTTPSQWYHVTVTNNIIANNVAGWDGGGVSLLDSLNVDLINNTIASNVTTASAGTLNNTLGAPLASTVNCPPGQTNPATGLCNVQVTTSTPQPSGLVSINDSAILLANLPATITCPANHGPGGSGFNGLTNGACKKASYPLLQNNIFWQNSAYYIATGALSAQFQQNVVSIYNAFTTTLAPTQPQAITTAANGAGTIITGGTGACVARNNWDIGVRGDTGPTNHGSGVTLSPYYSVLSDANNLSGYVAASLHNSSTNPGFVSQYCDGSRQPPELGSSGWAVPPGISDATVPNPIFNLTPVATVDEGNNWINLRWGPLSLTNPSVAGGASGNYGGGAALGNYGPAATIDSVTTTENNYSLVPTLDFYGNLRPETAADTHFDPGAVEFGSAPPLAVLSVTGGPLSFTGAVGYPSLPQTLTMHNTGTAAGTGIALTFSSPLFSRPAGAAGGTCTATLASGATCTINVVFSATALGPVATQNLAIAASVAVTGSPVILNGTGVAPIIAATLTPASWTVSHAANCPGTGVLGILACTLDPAQAFTLTNTGNVPLTGITQGVLGGTAANQAEYGLVRILSTCGPAAGGQVVATVTLAPGATCTTVVQFKPLTSQPSGPKPATISVTDAAGTQTSALNGSVPAAAVTFTIPAASFVTTPANTSTKNGVITVNNPLASIAVTLTAAPTITNVTPGTGTFSIASGGTCLSGTLINPGGSCTINVSYAPGGSTATATANVTLTGLALAGGSLTSANFNAN